MPHASLAPEETAANKNILELASVNGGNNPVPTPFEAEKLSDVFHLIVESPDGIQRTVILDERVSVTKLPQILEKVCRQLGIDDAMEAIVSENPIEQSDLIEQEENSDASRLVKSEEFGDISDEISGESKVTFEQQSEQPNPLYVPGKSILCHFCGFLSKDFSKCQRCKRKFSNSVRILRERAKKVCERFSNHEDKKKSQRKKKVEETECVTILSSDEEDKTDTNKTKDSVQEALNKAISEKEPVITETTQGTDCSTMSGGGLDLAELVDSPDTENCLFECRTIRIGSYKVVPNDKVLLTTYGLKMKVPNLKGEVTTLKILRNEIVKILVHFGVELPVLFYYITAPAGRKIRAALHMTGKDGAVYFDPTSTEEIHKRITLLPDSICEESRLFIRSIYEHNGLLGELDSTEANEILLRAATKKDVNNQGKKSLNSTPSSSSSCQEIQQIMIYPPPPVKGGISINTEDYACLGEDQFLNDVIIDFYLKYVVQNMLSEDDRKRTHVFSSFFYKRLTSSKNFQDTNSNLSPAEKRHARVKGWTKGVNIFAKDFIIIPINESSHWFLAIICFPGLQAVFRMSDNQAIEDSGRREAVGKRKNAGNIPNTIGETTITVVSQQANSTISLDPDGEERDEAEGNDEDLEPNSSDDESKENGDSMGGELMDEAFPKVPQKSPVQTVVPKPTYPHQDAIKQPCILVFDSLMGASRSRVIATLREYLHVEYKMKHKGATRDFTKDYVKGTVPKVPQQTNFTDCGLYVLQYVEEFFKNPLTDYRMPLKMQDWFHSEIVSRKRYEIQQLLHKLMDDQGVDRIRINLPRLDLRPDGRRYSEGENEEENMDVDEELGEEEIAEEEEDEEDEERMEEEEDEEHDAKEHHINVSSQVSLTPQLSVNPQISVTQQQVNMNQQQPALQTGNHQQPARSRTPLTQAVATSVRTSRPRTPVNKQPPPLAAARANSSPRQLVRPNVVLEPRTSNPLKRNVLIPSPDVTIRKKPNLPSPAPASSPTPPTPTTNRPSRMTPPVSAANLQRISASVEITKRKV